jgi:hypothetical protein
MIWGFILHQSCLIGSIVIYVFLNNKVGLYIFMALHVFLYICLSVFFSMLLYLMKNYHNYEYNRVKWQMIKYFLTLTAYTTVHMAITAMQSGSLTINDFHIAT